MSKKVQGGAAVRLDNVVFSYGDAHFIFETAFSAGAINAVMGASGSGKSTLLNLVAGFEVPHAGKVLIGGENVTGMPASDRPVSMVFQENNLFAHLTVEANVGLGISSSLRLTARDHEVVEEALARTGLEAKNKRLPRELSGGERQRVALARVLVRDRPVLLLDEPFASLGPALREDMLVLVAQLQAERHMTVLFVTHQPDDARRIADHVVFIEDGKVAASGHASAFFADDGPEVFRRYAGTMDRRSRHIARKPT